ncbi:hypothetical protein QFZ76_005442 [Streptomyces sp. V4I2]|nr:hypothetical protein [Streptomyces sp. V4I2]
MRRTPGHPAERGRPVQRVVLPAQSCRGHRDRRGQHQCGRPRIPRPLARALRERPHRPAPISTRASEAGTCRERAYSVTHLTGPPSPPVRPAGRPRRTGPRPAARPPAPAVRMPAACGARLRDAIVHSQPSAEPPTAEPPNAPAARHTARYDSCMTSATICSSEQRRRSRTAIHGDVRRYNSSNAARSPLATRRTSRSSSASANVPCRDLTPDRRPGRLDGFPAEVLSVTGVSGAVGPRRSPRPRRRSRRGCAHPVCSGCS